VRKELSAEIGTLEKSALEAYEKQDFKTCIAVTRRMLLINPDNGFARLYLKRAEKRYKAYQELR